MRTHRLARLPGSTTWMLAIAVVLLAAGTFPALRQALHVNVAMTNTVSWGVERYSNIGNRLTNAQRALAAWRESRGGATPIIPRQAQYAPYLQAYVERAVRWEENQRITQLYNIGQQNLAAGDYGRAATLFRQVLERDPHRIEAYVGLEEALGALGDTAAVETVRTDLLTLEPPLRLGEMHEQLWREVEQVQVRPGWYLLGYEVRNAWRVAYTPTLEMVFYWQRTDANSTGERLAANSEGRWQVITLGKRVWQIGSVPNLVPNAGFEQTFGQSLRRPTDWPYEKYTTSSDQIIDQTWTYRAGEPTLVVDLRNLTGPSGLVSQPIPVPSSDTVYLQAAWLKPDPNARPCLAREWLPHPTGAGPWRSYTVCNVSLPERWTHAASITRPYDNTVTEVRFWMLNIGKGSVLFDDLLFVPLYRPSLAGVD